MLAHITGFRPAKCQPLPVSKVLGRTCEHVRFYVHWDPLTPPIGPNSPQKWASKVERERGPFSKSFFEIESSDGAEGA